MRQGRMILFTVAVFLLAASLNSCDKDNEVPTGLRGEWHLESDSDGLAESGVIDVYVSFAADSFELFQKSGDAAHYRRFSGTYSLTDGILTGKYAGGSAWASGNGYTVILEDNNSMTMTSVDADVVCTYRRTAIPSEVRSGAIDTKSKYDDGIIPFL